MYAWLDSAVPRLNREYLEAKPFPHIVLHGLLDPQKIQTLVQEFPEESNGKWWKYENILEKKLARNDLHHLPVSIRNVIHEFQEHRFVTLIEKITGIPALIVDHTLNGAGLHQIVRGGKLDVHADYNFHPITGLDRRVNVLLYLNPDWKPGWNGSLELWNRDMTECVKSISPELNTIVIFGTTDQAFHGHPDPLQCPPGQSRKSIALYYYTNGRPSHERSLPHSTVFKRRPQDPLTEEHEELRRARARKRIGDST